MTVRAAAVALAGILTLTAGCSLKAPVAPPAPTPAEGVIGTSKLLAGLKGVAMAPASLISSSGSTLIADNGNGLISDKAAGYGLLAVDTLQPVADAEVEVQDAAGVPVPGVAKVKTDAKGAFSLKQVPAGVNWVLSVKAAGFQLTTIVRPTPAGEAQAVAVDPATTAVTEHLRQSFGQERRALRQVRPHDFDQLARAVKAKLDTGEVAVDLKPGGKAAEVLALVAEKDGGIGQAVKAVVQSAKADHETAKAKGQDRDDAPPVADTPPTPGASGDNGHKPTDAGTGNKPADKGPADPGAAGGSGDRAPNR